MVSVGGEPNQPNKNGNFDITSDHSSRIPPALYPGFIPYTTANPTKTSTKTSTKVSSPNPLSSQPPHPTALVQPFQQQIPRQIRPCTPCDVRLQSDVMPDSRLQVQADFFLSVLHQRKQATRAHPRLKLMVPGFLPGSP